ncbi:MAG: type II secretion system ATPase GspE [Thermodesulfobacteriota bacterium]
MAPEAKNSDSSIDIEIDHALARKVPLSFAKRYKVLPLRKEGEDILIAFTKEGFESHLRDDLRALFHAEIKPYFVESEELARLIAGVYYSEREAASGIIENLKKERPALSLDIEGPKDLFEDSEEGPVISFVNSLLSEALKKKASDIHLEPFEEEVRVRYRVDGILYDGLSLPSTLYPNVSTRIKVMASLNIAEKRLPQDGRIRIKVGGRDVDIRVSLIPTAFGERVVLRLLNREDIHLGLEDLGFETEDLEEFTNLIHRDHGLILVTGPTGAGKTTTLYAALSEINSPEKNILTIEDPIEYQLNGVGQMHVNPKIGLTFARGLRHILRQDPDVIMIGEIRDVETAEIAIHASLTGHLVIATLHTNDTAGAITRLLDMGVEPFLVSSTLLAVLAQRLVRILCPSCKEGYSPSQEELSLIKRMRLDHSSSSGKPLHLYKKIGCEECFNTGYRSRIGIYELLTFSDPIRRLIVEKADASVIKKEAVGEGMKSLKKIGILKFLKGVTTKEEVARVTRDG